MARRVALHTLHLIHFPMYFLVFVHDLVRQAPAACRPARAVRAREYQGVHCLARTGVPACTPARTGVPACTLACTGVPAGTRTTLPWWHAGACARAASQDGMVGQDVDVLRNVDARSRALPAACCMLLRRSAFWCCGGVASSAGERHRGRAQRRLIVRGCAPAIRACTVSSTWIKDGICIGCRRIADRLK
jgi:hypothetical protein